jgi:hypothetical protein
MLLMIILLDLYLFDGDSDGSFPEILFNRCLNLACILIWQAITINNYIVFYIFEIYFFAMFATIKYLFVNQF